MINVNNLNDLLGAAVYGSDDTKIGSVGQIYLDSETQEPSWVTVKTGLFGSSESFAPLSDATWTDGVVHVAYDKSKIKDAPRVENDGALNTDEEDALYRYYGNGSSRTTGVGDEHAAQGHDTSGPNTDDAMTRSEERLRVGTEKVETGRARLRKHVVTEHVTTTVPVTHEEVTLEREPITDANVGDAVSGEELSSEEHEVVLTGERVVVDKETVPVERVRLGTETHTEQQQVDEEVAREEIDMIEPDGARADRRPDAV